MKYYTKEWYELMQRQHYTSGLQKIPDKKYSVQEIQSFYDSDLAAEVMHNEMLYITQAIKSGHTIKSMLLQTYGKNKLKNCLC